MFVPYFLFLNVNFNVTVSPFQYQEILGFRDKGIPRHHNHTCTHKEARDLTSPATNYKRLLNKSLVLSLPNTPLPYLRLPYSLRNYNRLQCTQAFPFFSNFLSNHWQVIHLGLPTITSVSPLITGQGLVSFFCLPTFLVLISRFMFLL